MPKKYNEVTPEILEQFKAIVPGKVYAGEEINSDYFHDEMPIYGKGSAGGRDRGDNHRGHRGYREGLL